MEKHQVQVELQPIGLRIKVPAGTSVLEAAHLAGAELVALCGGKGVCGTCRVRLLSGELSPASDTEKDELAAEDLKAGVRLACEALLLGDARLEIPRESLTTPQRLQLEGQELPTVMDPVIRLHDVRLKPPDLDDLGSDFTRLGTAVPGGNARASLDVLSTISENLRRNGWHVSVALRGDEIVAIIPPGTKPYGLAVDVGTTKLAAYLVNLENGSTVAKSGAMNPQIAFGEDIISRIEYTNRNSNGARSLQTRLVDALNTLLEELCQQVHASTEQVMEAVIVGNTAMHHLLAGLPVRQLGESPYVAAVSEPLDFLASELDLHLSPGAHVYLPPNIAGYVGADHVSMLIGSRLQEAAVTTLALDIGTNTEISLFHEGKHWSCSCASGPAFEGAHIGDGMRAAPGAIERVRIEGTQIQVHTINEQAACGICGSGILDAVAEFRRVGLLDERGAFRGVHPNLIEEDGEVCFLLVDASDQEDGRRVRVSRKDINEIQLAKGAIRTGIEILLSEAGIQADQIEQFIVAGAFGTYLDVGSAIRIGMFPDIPLKRFRQVGNAAGEGARQLLVSNRLRAEAVQMSKRVMYVELARHAQFMKTYVKALAL